MVVLATQRQRLPASRGVLKTDGRAARVLRTLYNQGLPAARGTPPGAPAPHDEKAFRLFRLSWQYLPLAHG